MRVLPDFLIIGTMKGGTTSLFGYLTQHPDIASGWKKEVHFFDTSFSKGLPWYRAFFPTMTSVERHHRLTGNRLRVGEATPYYMFHPDAARRIQQAIPDVQLIAVLRDPVKRAFSHYNHNHQPGLEPLGFQQAVELEQERLGNGEKSGSQSPHQRFSYLARGRYAEQIRGLVQLFRLVAVPLSQERGSLRGPEENT